jgi:hypothetical protein
MDLEYLIIRAITATRPESPIFTHPFYFFLGSNDAGSKNHQPNAAFIQELMIRLLPSREQQPKIRKKF